MKSKIQIQNLISNLANEILFEYKIEGDRYYIGVSQIIIEWEDYQDERFCELTFATTNQPNPLDQVKVSTFIFKKTYFKFIKFRHWMQFSKPAGLRLTDISQESGVNVVYSPGSNTLRKAITIFKLAPLFPNQMLNIKNCVIEIEVFHK